MKDFYLKKWYLDAADTQGNVYTGYLVALQWRHLELHGENQWIAIAAVLLGICITMLPASLSANPTGTLNLAFFAAVLVGGVLTAFAMSMDFPKSTSRFSRLSG